MGEQGQSGPTTSDTSPGDAVQNPSLPPARSGLVPVGAIRTLRTYPWRGRAICWFFWKFWLNPFCILLRVFFARWNPYKRMTFIYVPDPRADHVESQAREAEEKNDGN